jgi:hypothetical protein
MYSKPEDRQNWAKEPDDSKKPHLKNISTGNHSPIYTDARTGSNLGNGVLNTRSPVSKPQKPQQPQQPQQQTIRPTITVQNDIEDEFCDVNEANNENNENDENAKEFTIPTGGMKTANLFKKDEIGKMEKMLQRQHRPTNPVERTTPQQTSTKNNQTRIVRSVPCGGGISFSSSK